MPAGGLREIEKEESRGGRCVGGGRKACEKVEKITRATSLLAVQGAIVLVDARLHFIDITTEQNRIKIWSERYGFSREVCEVQLSVMMTTMAAACQAAEAEEAPMRFDGSHYANGINGDFLADRSAEELILKFAGGSCGACCGGGGKFEDAEQRDIAAAVPAIMHLLTSTLALPGILVSLYHG